MVDILKRMRKEAEEKKQKERQGYSALFSKPKPVKEKTVITAWNPSPDTKKTVSQKQVKEPAANPLVQKEVKNEAIQKSDNEAGKSLGRYFEIKKTALGAGGTAKDANIEIHYFAEEVDGFMNLYLSSRSGKPTQIDMGKVSSDDFAKRFKPCSEHDCPFD